MPHWCRWRNRPESRRGFLSQAQGECQLWALLFLFRNSHSRLHFQRKSRCRPSSTEWQGGCGKAPSIMSMWVISWLWDTCLRSRGLLVKTLPQASFAPGPQAGAWVRQKLQPDVEGLSQHKDQPPDLLCYPALDSISESVCSYSPPLISQEPEGKGEQEGLPSAHELPALTPCRRPVLRLCSRSMFCR